jgi:hypothetical protein
VTFLYDVGVQALAVAVVIWPVEAAILWLIWNVRISVRKSSSMMDIAPELTEDEKVALKWTIGRTIRNELALYRAAKARGEIP